MDDGDSWAINTGTIWLNPAFVYKPKKNRIFKKRGLRLSIVELVWIIIMAVLLSTLLYFFFIPLSWILTFMPPIIPALAFGPIAGWFSGRKIASASPYRKLTGEGLMSYLTVQADSNSYVLKKLVGRTVAVNTYSTIATGKERNLPAIEWIGTARAPIMPKFNSEKPRDRTYIRFGLNTKHTDVMSKVRERDERYRRLLSK